MIEVLTHMRERMNLRMADYLNILREEARMAKQQLGDDLTNVELHAAYNEIDRIASGYNHIAAKVPHGIMINLSEDALGLPIGNRKVTLNMAPEAADHVFANIVRARDGLRQAVREETLGDVGYFLGWLDHELTTLGDAVPDKHKSIAKDDIKNYRAMDISAPQHGGGGRKPN